MSQTEVQIKQIIGQQEASIEKIEEVLDEEDFREYCDAIATTVTLWKCVLKQVRESEKQTNNGN